jgi:hypothetical protein
MTQVLTDEMLETAAIEVKRRGNARARVLEALRAAGSAGLLNWQLVQYGGMEAPRRVRELKAEGYDISVEHVSEGAWRYTYHPPTLPAYVPPGARAAAPAVVEPIVPGRLW